MSSIFPNHINFSYACMISLPHQKHRDSESCRGPAERERERNVEKKTVLLENTDSIEHGARGRRSMETDSLFLINGGLPRLQ